MNSNYKEKFPLLLLPEEIILYIATFLTTTEVFQGLGSTCWYLNNLVGNASSYGNVANFLFISNIAYINLKSEEQHALTQHIIQSCTPCKGIDFDGFDYNSGLLSEIIKYACKNNSITQLKFRR